MRPFLRIAVGFLIILFGYKAVRHEFGGFEVGILSELDYIPLGIVVILTIVILLVDHSFYKIDRKKYQFTFSLIALSICLIIFSKIIYRNSIYNSKTILKIINKAGADNVWKFDFNDNKHFILTDYNLFGHTIYNGMYQRKGDTILITQTNYNGNIKQFPNFGIIKSDTIFWNKFDTMLVVKE